MSTTSTPIPPSRKKRTPRTDADVATAVVQAALMALGLGQSSVQLELDSKGQVKPTVHVYHRSPTEAARMAEVLFDRQLLKYQPESDATKAVLAAKAKEPPPPPKRSHSKKIVPLPVAVSA